MTVYTPSPVMFPDGIRRVAQRPLEYRDGNFEDRFDFDTMFYDCVDDGTRLFLVGPPMAADPPIRDLVVLDDQDGRELPAEIVQMDRHSQIRVMAPAASRTVRLAWPEGEVRVTAARTRPTSFTDRRVLLTMSKNNDLDWILDWVRFHRDTHGVDGVLLYDNASTRYSAEDVERALMGLKGLVTVQVVAWPFKYGVPGFRDLGFWDSNFAQPGAFEHARRYFLHDAAGVINSDIDELVVGSRTGRSVFRAAERSRHGIVRYVGCWVASVTDEDVTPPKRHKNYRYRQKIRLRRSGRKFRPEVCDPKWTVIPSRCPDRSQWHTHNILGWKRGRSLTVEFAHRHFRALTTNWKYERAEAEPYCRSVHRIDRSLLRWFAGVRWDE